MEWSTILTFINLLAVIILGISEIHKRRAEARSLDISADTKMMTEIKSSAMDLLNESKIACEKLQIENQRLIDLVIIQENELKSRNEKYDLLNKAIERINCLEDLLISLEIPFEDCVKLTSTDKLSKLLKHETPTR